MALRRLREQVWRPDLLIYPGAIAFHLIACAIPFLLVLLSAFGMVLSKEAAFRAVARFLVARLPTDSLEGGTVFLSSTQVQQALQAVMGRRATVGIVGVVSLLITASGLMHVLRSALNAVFKIAPRRHPVGARLYGVVVFCLVGWCLFLSIFFRWGFTLGGDVLMEWLGGGQFIIRPALKVLLAATTFLFNFGALYLVYRFLPDEEPRRGSALAAAASSALLWELARFAMGLYLRRALSAYSLLYGAATVFVVLGVWAYYASFIFVGCAIAGRALGEIAGPA